MLRPVFRPLLLPVVLTPALAILLGVGARDAAIRRVFASGVDGYYADPSDLLTAYQDSAGKTAGAVDQPVGLRLDKSDGLVLDVEDAPNGGTFDSATGWTLDGAAATISGGRLRITGATGAASGVGERAYFVKARTAGEVHRISVTVESLTNPVRLTFGALNLDVTQPGTYSQSGVVTGSSTNSVYMPSGGSCVISAVSSKKLLGNHTTQSTSTSRPVQKSISGYAWEGFDGTDDFRTSATGGGGTTGFFYCAPVYVAGGAGATRILWSDRGTTAGYGVYISAANVLSLVAGNGSADTTVATVATLPVGETHIVTAWDDGANLCVQIDNGTVATAARPAVAAGTAGFTEGRLNGDVGSYFNGRLGTRVNYKNYSPDSATREQIKRFIAIRNGITLT